MRTANAGVGMMPGRCLMKYLREMWRLGTLTYRILCLTGRGGDAFGAFEGDLND
ncbi:hypothetical protein Syun_029332 [Stephania yunnanensis]|uniref:Uncharacterized protein n=1 Tax=Stephania yunnanensis TaxID=152371 RepID=A0AAP0HFX5_9MAGN